MISTNDRDPKNSQYRGLKLATWFLEMEQAGLLKIEYSNSTYRSIQAIADFADTIFPARYNFKPTASCNAVVTDHDGLYVVAVEDLPSYQAQFSPQCLLDDVRRGADIEADFHTFGTVKGRTWKRVAIAPTGTVIDFIANGRVLAEKSACQLYVGVTRAEQTVAFILPNPARLPLPQWKP